MSTHRVVKIQMEAIPVAVRKALVARTVTRMWMSAKDSRAIMGRRV